MRQRMEKFPHDPIDRVDRRFGSVSILGLDRNQVAIDASVSARQ